MNLQGIKNRIYWWAKKIVLYGLFSCLCILVGSFLILQIPSVQTSLTGRIMKKFSRVSGFVTAYDRFYLVWYDRLEIDGLKIADPAGNMMIAADRIRINFRLSDLWQNHDIHIDGAKVDGAQVNLVRIPGTDSIPILNINRFVTSISQQFKAGNTRGKTTRLTISNILINQASFSYNDPGKDSIVQGFDYAHFSVDVPKGEFEDFNVAGDTIQFQVSSLSAVEKKTKLDLKELKTYFRYYEKGMEFTGLKLQAGQSSISDSIAFHFRTASDMSDFNTKVNFIAKLKGTTIDPSDLAHFAPGAEKLGQPLHLDGVLEGKLSRFTFRNMRVGLGNTLLAGQLKMDGLPALHETFITLNLKEGDVRFDDIRFLFPDDVYDHLKPLGNFHVRGKFLGFIDDFVANGDITTRLGNIRSDINLKINETHVEESTYHGRLELDNFNLGAYFSDTVSFQRVSLRGQIDGKGLTEQTADFSLNGKISSLGLWKYNYLNITTDAHFAKQLFSGKLTIDDPNLKFNASGSVDLRKGHDFVKLKANLDTALLRNLHFSKDDIFISSYVEIDSRGLQVDSLFGNAVLKNSTFKYNKETIHFDSIRINSGSSGQQRTLSLRSSLLDVTLEGSFFYSTLFNDFDNLFHEFYLNLRNDKKDIAEYYQRKRKSNQQYGAKLTVQVYDVNPLAKVFGIPLTMSRNTSVTGAFTNGSLSILHLYSLIDTVQFEGKYFLKNEIEFSGSKIRDSSEVLAAITVKSDDQELSPAFNTKNLLVRGIWNGDHVDVGVDFDQKGIDNLVRLRSEIDFLQDSTKITMLPSRIRVLEREWEIDPKNYTMLHGKEWRVNHLEIHHENQLIQLDGRISPSPDPALKLTFASLNLDILNTLSTEKFDGILNGTVTVRDLYNSPYLQNNIAIKDLTVDGFLIGNLTGTNIWNQTDNRFDIGLFIDRLDKRIVGVAGFYDPKEKENPLVMKATLQETNLKIMEPLLRGIFSQLDGTISGTYDITGTFTDPKINGEGKIVNGQIMIDYLKTLYTFSGSLGMSAHQVIFKDFILIDAFKNKATLEGYLAHRAFTEMQVSMNANFTNFQLLNTTTKDNNLFYGQGYATGKLSILGPVSNLKISATARTEKNTKIFIPLNGTTTIEKNDFINFTHFTSVTSIKANKAKRKENVELSGISMDLNLDITPAALVEIIFDIKSGDIIRGRGNGDIKLQLDTKGEFNMFGSVEFTEGAYNFTLYDIINKEFSINKGGRISWFGDPYQANMNIIATYKQLALVTPILQDQTLATSTAPGLRRRYPIEVILKLDGPMLSPQINFDIDAKDLPNSVSITDQPNRVPESLALDFIAFKARLDEQELKKQVFSLIMLRRFSPIGESISTSGGISNSVSELFSNQLSYWLSQMDQNLEIDIDLGAFDQEAFNTFQLRLSYSFLNGRLRVTRDGAFNNQYNRSDVSSFAGDWTVDYLLTPDGKFKVKMYSRTNANTFTSALGTLGSTQAAITTGVSLLHTQNFNQISDLLRSSRDRKRREMEKQQNEQAAKEEEEQEKALKNN